MKLTFTIEPLEARIAPAFAPVMELSGLNGTNGFSVTTSGTLWSVSDAGDVNGDGFGDFIMGEPSASPHGRFSGASYVVFGEADGFSANLNVSSLDGSNGFKISGAAASDYSGRSVSGAGDLNGDGFDDIIIGAHKASPNGTRSGACYVVFGKASGFAANLDLSALNGSNGFKLSGTKAGDYTGMSVRSAGDVNGDGFGDIIVGAPEGMYGSYSGKSYVVFGKASGYMANLNLSGLTGSEGFKISGSAVHDFFGTSVSAAGDVNGDGFDDVIVGALRADPNGSDSGASYVIFGKASGFAANLNVSALNGSNGFKLSGVSALDYAGRSVGAAADINGDGFDDVIIGADYADANGLNSGASYVLFGKASGISANVDLSTVDGKNGFKLSGAATYDNAGWSVSGAGDVNGDGLDDFIIGARQAQASSGVRPGAGYVIFGRTSGFGANLDLSALNGNDGFKMSGAGPGDQAGFSVSGAGDINGDGFEDMVVGALLGRTSYVVFGKGVELNVSDATVTEGSSGVKVAQFALSLSEVSAIPITVEVATIEGTARAGVDFNGVAGATLSFAPGETSKTFSIEVLGDTTLETDETFSLLLSDAHGGVIRRGTAAGTIRNDDAPPVLSIAGASVLEGDSGTSSIVFTVSLSEVSGLSASVNFTKTDGTAVAGIDYIAPDAGTLTIAPGETAGTIAVEVLSDLSIEDHETLSVTISGASGGTIGTATAEGTILNDDTVLRISSLAARERDAGETPFTFEINMEKASALPVTVSYHTIDGTAIGGSDYESIAPTQVTFAPGETTKTVGVSVLGDSEVEAHENFSVGLSGATGAFIAEGTGTGLIQNDDTLIYINAASILEGHVGHRTMAFTVSLTADSILPVSIEVASVDGTATAGVDYVALGPDTLEFAPGETVKTLTVDVLSDTTVEPTETLTVVLSNPVNGLIGNDNGLGTIENDDITLTGRRSAIYTDVDGDLVTIKVSKGTLKVEDFFIFPTGSGSHLALVDFSGDTDFSGADLRITAKKDRATGNGDGMADVSAILATGIDLRKVSIKGNLGQIDIGSGAIDTTALRRLSAHSLGVDGLAVPFALSPLQSAINGSLKKLTLLGGMHETELSVTGDLGLISIAGDLLESAIRSDARVGSIKVGGDLAGTAENHATISALGEIAPLSDAKALAIGSIAIGGSVEHAQILAGYDRAGEGINADVRLGKVTIAGDWVASSLVSGVAAGEDALFGTADDMLFSTENSVVAGIASIVIKGSISGSSAEGDHFGFVAEEIGSFQAGGAKISLTKGASNDLVGLNVGATDDTSVREFA